MQSSDARQEGPSGGKPRPYPLAFLLTMTVLAALAAYGLLLGCKWPGTALGVRWVVAVTPALLVLLAAFHPTVLEILRSWTPLHVAWLAGGLTVWTFAVPATVWNPAPYTLIVVASIAVGSVLALSREEATKLGGVGLVIFLLLWLPHDFRWYSQDKHMALWLGPRGGLDYAGFALWISAVATLAFSVSARRDLGFQPPQGDDLWRAPVIVLSFGALAIPIGLLAGFLKAHYSELGPWAAFLRGLDLLLVVALAEELFFRGILDKGLQPYFKQAWPSLVISSLAFGIMHWNNGGPLGHQLSYLALSSIAGVFYGLAFRWTGGLLAPVLVHTAVDLLWKMFLG